MLEILHDIAPGRRARLRHRVHQRRVVRRQHPRAALRRRLRRDRRRRPLLRREPVPGRPDRAVGQRRHRRRRAVLQLGRQRGQHARRHVRQLRGRLPRLRPRRRQVRRRGARLRSRPGGAGVRADLRRLERERPGARCAGPTRSAPRPTTTTSTCSTTPATLVNFSQDVQDGDDDPYEILGTPTFGWTGLRLAVVRYSGAPRYFQLSALRRALRDVRRGLPAWVTPGVTRGHSAAAQAFSVAAAPAAEPLPFDLEPGDPPNPTGPFPGVVHRRAAAGALHLRRAAADVLPAAPAPGAAEAGHHRRRRRDTSVTASSRSSAPRPPRRTRRRSPALVLSGNPGATTADVREAFNATALDLAPAGVDARTGHGLLRADSVLDYTGRDAAAAGPGARRT